MTINTQVAWNYYSRESIIKAIAEVAKDREVVSVFRDGRFGKRPDIIQYPQDVLQAVANGTVAFHGSVERWQQPMKLDVGMNKPDLDKLRAGWDILIDIDVDSFEIAKIAARRILDALKDHGLMSYNIKFTGGSSFHIGIPFESMPEKINMVSTSQLYPDLMQKIIEYLKWYVKDQLKEDLLVFKPQEISQKIGKSMDKFTTQEGIDPFKIVSMDVFGSRHLFRLPYSLHESSGLISLPIKPLNLEKFEKTLAMPEKVKVDEKFLSLRIHTKDAEALIVEASDWASKYMAEKEVQLPKMQMKIKMRVIQEDYFPPCIKTILAGMKDGRKRSAFVLINFLRNMGWDSERIERRITDWNEKNEPPLRTAYLRAQLRWHFRQDRNLLPPNCENENFYKVLGLYDLCSHTVDHTRVKNPVNYPFRVLKMHQNEKGKRNLQKDRRI
jgi:DNA primase large subunit